MTREACFDANVFLSALDDREPHHREALRLLQATETSDILMMEPAIVVFEVASVMTRKSYRKELDAAAAMERIDYFSQLPLLLQWQPWLLKKSAELAERLGLGSAYDCSYLAVAEARNIPFVTLDSEFSKKARRIYGNIVTPSQFMSAL